MKATKLFSIQYLRAIAAFLVVIAHASAHPLPAPPIWAWLSGRLGVTLFFVISGFIMVLVTGTGPFDPLRFLKSRIYRIVPLYWTITGLAAAGACAAPQLYHKTIFEPLHLLASLLFVPMLRPGNPGMIEPFVKLGWTLNYEMFFYLAFTALFFTTARTRAVTLVVIFVGLTTIGQVFAPEQTLLRFYTSYDLFAFGVGCCLGVLHQRGVYDRIGRASGLAIGLASAVAILLGFVLWAVTGPRLDRQVVLTALSAGLLISGLVLERTGLLKPHPAPLFVGDASYSIYLAHMFAVGAVAVLAAKVFGAELTWPQYGATVFAGAIGGIALGLVMFIAVERPFMHLLLRRKPDPAGAPKTVAGAQGSSSC